MEFSVHTTSALHIAVELTVLSGSGEVLSPEKPGANYGDSPVLAEGEVMTSPVSVPRERPNIILHAAGRERFYFTCYVTQLVMLCYTGELAISRYIPAVL